MMYQKIIWISCLALIFLSCEDQKYDLNPNDYASLANGIASGEEAESEKYTEYGENKFNWLSA